MNPAALISVVIPTHNPDPGRLMQTLLGLRAQSAEARPFETLVVDNASTRFPDAAFFLECAPEDFQIVREERLGLTAARLAGFGATRGDLVILVDDDNVLEAGYIAAARQIARDHPFLMSWSGNVELAFEAGAVPPPTLWRSYLTERVCVRAVWSNDPGHNASTPWGAGMCVRRALADAYRDHCSRDSKRLSLDLSGDRLTYGGDTDIAYFGCAMGFGMGVFPQLRLKHLIPAGRCDKAYLLRAIEGHAYSEWLHHWILNGKLPAEPGGLRAGAGRILRRLQPGPGGAAERACASGRRRAAREFGRSP